MQAYEHILTVILSSKCNKKELLALLKKYGAYFTYPDSVRGAISCPNSLGKAYRQPSHFTDGASMKFIIGEDLQKKVANGFPRDNISTPIGGLKLKAADGLTDLTEFKKTNEEILDKPEGIAIFNHLYQDTCTDDFFQKKIAKCYSDNTSGVKSQEKIKIYDVLVEDGLAKLNYTGKTISMSDFRKAISLIQKLSTLELFKQVKKKYPDITFEEIRDSINYSYDNTYPECMMNAKKYIVPSEEEQMHILKAIDKNDESYYSTIEDDLISMGVFNNKEQIKSMINKLCYDTCYSQVVTSNLQKIKSLVKY